MGNGKVSRYDHEFVVWSYIQVIRACGFVDMPPKNINPI